MESKLEPADAYDDRFSEGVYSDQLGCNWLGWRVVGAHSLALDLPSMTFPDMEGAIRAAQALLPGVREIRTFCDGKNDTLYSRVGTKWTSTPAKGQQG